MDTIPFFDPHTLMLVPSMGCMAECAYCFGPHDGPVMDKAAVEATAALFARLWENKPDRKIVFHGGEPLLAGHEWFEFALDRLSREFHSRVRFSIQSNLWNLDQRFVDLFAAYQVAVSTSLDGDRDICDRQRGTGYFDNTMKGIRLLRANGMDVSAIATVMPRDIENVPEIFRFFERERLPFTLRGAVPPLDPGHGGDPEGYFMTSADAERLHALAFAYLEDAKTTLRIRDVEVLVRNVYAGDSSFCMFSNCLGKYAAVAPDGKIYSCQRFCGAAEYAIGDVFAVGSADDVRAGAGFRRLAETHLDNTRRCGDCGHLAYCNGGCLYNLCAANKRGKPRPFCNGEETPNWFYRNLFDDIGVRLAREAAEAMRGNDIPTPYLAMAEKAPRPPRVGNNREQFVQQCEWGKTRAPRHAFSSLPRTNSLYLNITNNCPLRCTHCSVDAGAGNPDMPLADALSVVRDAVRIGYRELSLNGGEPFAYGDFPALVEGMGEIPRAATRFALFTNLYCDFDDRLASMALRTFDRIVVSLDGDREEHDLRRGQGSFDRTCANIGRLAAMNTKCTLSVRATLTPLQKERGVEERVSEVAKGLGISRVAITGVLPIGRARSLEGVFSIRRSRAEASFFELPARRKNTCGMGSSLHVTPEGDVYPCWAVIGHVKPLGNIRDGLIAVTREYRLGRVSCRSVDDVEECAKCDVRYVCGGKCYALRNADCDAKRDYFRELAAMATRVS